MTIGTTTIKFLKQPTSDAWVEQALANLDTILLDHSHCKRKAAGVALATTYYDRDKVDQRLDELASVESELLATLHPEPRIHS